MVWEITVDTWELSGRPLPDYSRAEMPLRLLRAGKLVVETER
jgi:hypothetical protein